VKKLFLLFILLVSLSGCESESENSNCNCYLNYTDSSNVQQRLYVSDDAFFDAIDVPKGAYSTYYLDSQQTIEATIDHCHDDADIYADFTYLTYDTSIYEIDRYTVEVETIYNNLFSMLYISSNNRIFMELFSIDFEDTMIDITDYIPFTFDEAIKDLKIGNNSIFLLTTTDRLFAIDRFISADQYFEEGIYVEFITENVNKIDIDVTDTFILTHSNNVYRIIENADNSLIEVEYQKMINHFEGVIIDFFIRGSSVYFVTDNDEIYYCSCFDYSLNIVTDEFSECSKLETFVPFDVLYQSFLNEESYIHYNDNVYYINLGNVQLYNDYVNPLNDTEELLFSYFQYTDILVTTEHIYIYDLYEQQYIDINSLVPLDENETIIDVGSINDGDYGYKVLLSNQGNMYVSNRVDYYSPSDITEFKDIEQVESIDTMNIIGFEASDMFLKLILSDGTIVEIKFGSNFSVESITYAYPSNLSKVDVSFTLKDDISSIFGPTYNESNLYIDQLYLEHVDFDQVLDSPFRYHILFFKPNE
jgi:hypothetical protein